MRTDIYTPKSITSAIVREGIHNLNPNCCTKIMVGDFEISISMDTSVCGFDKDMTRTEIRIYDSRTGDATTSDVTLQFAKEMRCCSYEARYHIFSTSDDLFDIMVHARILMARKKRTKSQTEG